MVKVYRILFVLHAFVGICAFFGGLGTILNPKNPFGVSIEPLKNSPFSDYLIPGIILFTVIGLGNIISAILFRFKLRLQAYISGVFSLVLIIWIIIQCIILDAVVFRNILFFVIAVIKAVLVMIILFKRNMFPANFVISFSKQIKVMIYK
jgi:hypothetical protein